MEIEASALSSLCFTKSKKQKNKNKTNKHTEKNNNNKNKENFKSNLVFIIVLESKGLYCCILTSWSTIVSQQLSVLN